MNYRRLRGGTARLHQKVSKMHSLQKSLHIASSLARCDKFIRSRLRETELTPEETDWILNLFIINSPVYKKNTGDIAFMLYALDHNLAYDLVPLSDKIKKEEQLNQVDWDLILCGMEKYRKKLINQSYPQQDCGCIY
jgi:hypothetical protein